jgi:hypothetical protein
VVIDTMFSRGNVYRFDQAVEHVAVWLYLGHRTVFSRTRTR